MANYGSAVSQKGYDVKTCADRFLVYSSAFQTLKIFNTYSVSTTIPSSGINTIRINHNLGFIAPYIIIYNGSSSFGIGQSYFFSDSSGNALDDMQRTNSLSIDIYLNFDEDNSNTGDTVYFTVIQFLNDFTAISHSEKNTGNSSGSSSSNYGIKISKPGYDVKTCADKDCVLSSSYFNQIIDQVNVYTATSDGYKTINYTSLGYIPAVLSFTQDSGDDYICYTNMLITSDNIQTDYSLNSGDKIYYIILKNSLN